MKGTRSFIIKGKPSFFEMLKKSDGFYHYLAKDVIISVQLSDRHGFKFDKVFEEIKILYMRSVAQSLPDLCTNCGFDYYWSFEEYPGRVISLDEVIQIAGLTHSSANSSELNYLIQINTDLD